MQEDTLLICRKTGKTGEDSNPANSQHSILLLLTNLIYDNQSRITEQNSDISYFKYENVRMHDTKGEGWGNSLVWAI